MKPYTNKLLYDKKKGGTIFNTFVSCPSVAVKRYNSYDSRGVLPDRGGYAPWKKDGVDHGGRSVEVGKGYLQEKGMDNEKNRACSGMHWESPQWEKG